MWQGLQLCGRVCNNVVGCDREWNYITPPDVMMPPVAAEQALSYLLASSRPCVAPTERT